MEERKVSVVVPVYNAEAHLERCLDSIMNQTLREIEIICVDDGSADSSPEILKRYADGDPRFLIHTQENSGVGAARNKGLDLASGEYLIFWDSDDYFDLNALEKLYQKAKEDDADICVCGLLNCSEDPQNPLRYESLPNKRLIPEEMPFSIHDCPDHILDFSNGSLWNKLLRLSFIREKGLRFQPDMAASDVQFISPALCLAERITVLYEPLIYYSIGNPNGLALLTPEKWGIGVVDSWLLLRDSLKSLPVFPERSFVNRALGAMLWYLRISRHSRERYEQLFARLKNGDLEKLGIVRREPGFYYSPWQERLLNCLLEQSAEEFALSYLFEMDLRMKEQFSARYQMRQKQAEKNQKNAETTAALKEKITQLRAEKEEQKEKITQLRSEKDEQKEKIAQLRAEKDEQKEKIAQLRAERNELKKQIEALNKTLNAIESSKAYKAAKTISDPLKKIKSAIG